MATAVSISKQPKLQFFDANGNPLAGGKLYTYAAGTSTPQTAYTDYTGNTPQSNPIILDARGECSLWLSALQYKMVLQTSTSVEVWTVDGINNADVATLAVLAASNGASLVGYKQSNSNITTRTVETRLRDRMSVKDFGAVGDGVTDDYAALRRAITAAESADLFFPPGTYNCSQTLSLVDSSGNNWNGRMFGQSATIAFTFTGTNTDSDANMVNGMSIYPKTIAIGSDIAGSRFSIIDGLKFTGPTNGCALRIANSQMVTVKHCDFNSSRYGLVTECCINTQIINNYFNDCINAGIGMLMTNNTSKVYYGSLGGVTPNDAPNSTYWNDSPEIQGNLIQGNGAVFAAILDHGSQAEGIRNIQNNIFYTSPTAPTMYYGYVVRNASPTLTENWTENLQVPIRFLNTNASLGGSSNVLMSGATVQPGGTYPLSRIVDGYCTTAVVKKNYFALPTLAIDASGVTGGPMEIGGNISQVLGSIGRVSSVIVAAGGSGYSAGTTITFSGGAGSGATAYPVVVGGVITSVVITNTGSGYTSPPTITLGSTGGGSGATFGTVQLGTHIYSSQAGSQWITDNGDTLVVPYSVTYSLYKNLRYEQYTKLNTNMGQLRVDISGTGVVLSSAGTLTSANATQYSYFRIGQFVFFDAYINVTTIGTGSGNIRLLLPSGFPMTTAIQFSANGTYGSTSIGLVGVPITATYDRIDLQLTSGSGNVFASGAGNGHISGWYVTSTAM